MPTGLHADPELSPDEKWLTVADNEIQFRIYDIGRAFFRSINYLLAEIEAAVYARRYFVGDAKTGS